MNEIFERFKFLTKNSDLAVAVGLLLILSVMVVPISPFLLDLLIALTLAITVMILLVSVYITKPLDFSTFPSLLLVVTLFRISLNVASTRNILLNGATEGTSAAGKIIQSFGEFVVEGNYVVGIVVFSILVITNFVVITKGAGRVAEVSARFILDAMPGKQMAIDADLNAGLIDEDQARARRKEVASEADFYGSMDGASKFVRGEAIASILITVLNIIAGMIIGIVQYDMDLSAAAESFTLLTVGDGLVSQVPAIVISVAAGIIATRNTDENALGTQVGKEFKVHPKALYITGGVLLVFATIPGLPVIPFLFMGGGLVGSGYWIEYKNSLISKVDGIEKEDKEMSPEGLEDLLPLELVELEVGYGLVHLVDAEQNGDLLERITHIRKQFAEDWGVIIPSIRIKDNLELNPTGYIINIKGIKVATGELMADHYLAMDPGSAIEKIDGVETVEPVFGLPAVWITEDQRDDAQYNGHTVVDLSTIVATHITEIIKSNVHELFGRQELSHILDHFKENNPKIVNDLIPDILPFGTVLKVIQNLLKEGVGIRDLRTILEKLAEHGPSVKKPHALTELVRQGLYRTITELVKSDQGDIPVYTLDKNVEESFASNIIDNEGGQDFSLESRVTQGLLASLNEKTEEATGMGEKMVVLCSATVRGHFKRLIEKFLPNVMVVSHDELRPDINIRSLGTVRL